MIADSLAKNTQIHLRICLPTPKALDFNKKKLHWASVFHDPGQLNIDRKACQAHSTLNDNCLYLKLNQIVKFLLFKVFFVKKSIVFLPYNYLRTGIISVEKMSNEEKTFSKDTF